MNMYQRPTYHWKLECSAQGEYTVDAALQEFQDMVNKEPAYIATMKAFSSWSVAAVVLNTLTVWIPPVGMVLGGLLQIAPTLETNELNDILDSG